MSEEQNHPMGEEESDKESLNPTDQTPSKVIPLLDEESEAISPRMSSLKISLTTFLLSSISLVLAAVMLTYTLCSGFYREKIVEAQNEAVLGGNLTIPPSGMDDSLALFSALFDYYSISAGDVDEQAVMNAALKEFVRQTGDRYAAYYTAEELVLLQQENVGQNQGIGVSVIASTVNFDGVDYTVMKISNVMKDSPAMEAGLLVNDLIVYVGLDENLCSVHSLGFDLALSNLRGVSGTVADFIVWRDNGQGGYTEIPFSIERREFTESSVTSHVCQIAGYEKVGIVKISQFNLITPTQFSDAMDDLIAQGCTQFVFDVRYNPGGDLASIKAVLSYFLWEGDVIIRTRDKNGTEDMATVGVIDDYSPSDPYAACNVSREDIGKYRNRGFEFTVLCNGNTASAAELFTAVLRDYELATVVGTTTYGKGSMQTVRSLALFGLGGALKMTTAWYFPPSGNGYDGVGIEPHVTVALSEEAAKINVYEIKDSEDNQLTEALKQFSKS